MRNTIIACLGLALIACDSTRSTTNEPNQSAVNTICSQAVNMDVTDLRLSGKWLLKGVGASMEMADCVPINLKSMFLEFKENGRVDGTSSCNSFTANYASAGNTLQFSGLGVTEMMCTSDEVMSWERSYIRGIEAANGYDIVGNSLQLKTNNAQDLFFIRNMD